ncbi:MAG: hypothetical protein E7355_00880 [Clostridiales bacterium]|nr:hypothetical protein [Clostridiales bacterium]
MQYLVNVGNKEERKEKLKWLEEHGYTGNIRDDYPYHEIIIDWGIYFEGNVTCFAAAAMCGTRVMSWEDWLQAKLSGKLYC